ncbi:HupE/UreJ family protein [Maritimibacter sp. UBA3975]|uniref:HupE/UreJ family protein n=1 Tax=Maritimibacter sp. UBA3975 TaxID=1946833 RepID=UPI0025B9EBEE|nr:HupE/UreJ family protein [Maritimibacter sp. UBA3975]
MAKSTARALVVAIVMLTTTLAAAAHEMSPAVADITVSETRVELSIILQGEAIVAGIDLSSITDTNNSPRADAYDALRDLPPDDFAERFREDWPELSEGVRLMAGDTALDSTLDEVGTAEAMSEDLPRETRIVVSAALPDDGSDVTFGWASDYGPVILRQIAPDLPEGEEAYSAFLGPGQTSAPLPRVGSMQLGWVESFVDYVGLGFTHILPKGLDHILFVLGLFFFSLQMRPLLYQVTSFTVAHTITLALAALGIVTVPVAVVEPLIALSIAYVAVENILRPKLSRVRLAVVFGFGLLHGLGFASVLGEIGLSPGHFISSLIAFNIGVELGQLTVIAVAFFAIAFWFGQRPWYRQRVVIPASLAIGAMGLWWTVERVIL